MDYLTTIGLLAGLITTSGLVPQIIKGYRSGRMEDVSLLMPFVLMTGMALWLIYGLFLADLPIVFWNGVGIVLNAMLIALKLRTDNKKAKELDPPITG